MSYEGQHRAENPSFTRKKRFVAGALTITAVLGGLEASASTTVQPDSTAHHGQTVAGHFNAPQSTPARQATSGEQPLTPDESIRQHRVRLLVGSIAQTLYSEDMVCGGIFEAPECAFRTFAYEEPTSVYVKYASYDAAQSENEQDVQQLEIDSYDCSVVISKDARGDYRTIISADHPDTQAVGYNPAAVPFMTSAISDSDIECLANTDQRLKALPNEYISYEVAGTYRV